MTNNYVAYMLVPSRRGSAQIALSNQISLENEQQIKQFIHARRPQASLLHTFVEIDNNKRNRSHWKELELAIAYCKQHQANLLLVQIGNLSSNTHFTAHISSFLTTTNLNLYCCTESYITKENFEILAEHNQRQKKIHGDLIKRGLKNTNAKSGNPNALNVIQKVNKPKIDNAIIFALILQPIIFEYKKHNYSQRKIVNMLNEEGFCAPEGGKWVLSQLQKVLERLCINNSAVDLEDKFLEYNTKNMRAIEISAALNEANIIPPKGRSWTEGLVKQVKHRIAQLNDINDFNKFILELLPTLQQYSLNELDEKTLLAELCKLNIGISTKETHLTV